VLIKVIFAIKCPIFRTPLHTSQEVMTFDVLIARLNFAAEGTAVLVALGIEDPRPIGGTHPPF
jgi:hypothetical protein